MVVVISIGMDSSPVNTSFSHVIKPKSHSSGESEAALIRMNEDGSILTAAGTTPQGQGLFAALLIDERAALRSRPAQLLSSQARFYCGQEAEVACYALLRLLLRSPHRRGYDCVFSNQLQN